MAANNILGGNLLPNQTLGSGRALVSSDGSVVLAMQADGNLVMYTGGRVLWATNTSVAGSYLTFQGDGNLVIYTPSRKVPWATNSGGGATVLAMQSDGNLVIYNGNTVKWASNTRK
jgi:hypothetical protein